MGRRLWAVAIAAAVLAGCGGDRPAPPAPEPQPPGTATAPAGPSGPSGATGPDSPPTPTPNPNPNPNPTPNPTPTPACDGLVPEAPGPGVALRHVDSTGSGFAFCQDPITDGHGDWIGVGVGYKWFNYRFVSAVAPAHAGGFFQVPRAMAFGGGFPIAPQPDGYHALLGDSIGYLQRFDGMGALIGEDGSLAASVIQGVPGGGSVLAAVEGWPGPNVEDRVVWLGAGGERRAAVAVPGSPSIVVSSAGNVLVFAAGQARWYDRDGAPMTGWFPYDAQAIGRRPDAVALADGSVVVGLGTDRALRFEPGAAAAAPPPGWVTSRAGARIAAVRANRANAFATVKSAPAAACEVEIEILTPAGQPCGTTRLTAPDPCERVTFGADRTVFTMAQQPAADCVWHWWTGLLR